MSPTGSIVRAMRLREVETDAGGAEYVRCVTAPGLVIRLRGDHPNPVKNPAKMRADFLRFCRSLSVIPTAVEHAAADDDGEPVPTAFQVMGELSSLRQVIDHYAVAGWHFAISARVPWSAA